MTTLNDIAAVDWSPKVGAPGSVVEGIGDLDQCIMTILTTPRGSRPHEPLFGSDIYRYIDFPLNEAIPRIIRAAVEAVELWEPRVRIVRVVPGRADAAVGTLKLTIEWKLKESVMETRRIEVTL